MHSPSLQPPPAAAWSHRFFRLNPSINSRASPFPVAPQIRLALSPQAPLEELSLAGCRGLISVDVVALQLQTINLTGAFALSTLVLRVPALRRLVIGQCRALENIAFFDLPPPAAPAPAQQVAAAQAVQAAAGPPPPLPALRELFAPGCTRLEEATINVLAVRRGSPALANCANCGFLECFSPSALPPSSPPAGELRVGGGRPARVQRPHRPAAHAAVAEGCAPTGLPPAVAPDAGRRGGLPRHVRWRARVSPLSKIPRPAVSRLPMRCIVACTTPPCGSMPVRLRSVDASGCQYLRSVTIKASRVAVLNLTNCAALGQTPLAVDVTNLGKVLGATATWIDRNVTACVLAVLSSSAGADDDWVGLFRVRRW